MVICAFGIAHGKTVTVDVDGKGVSKVELPSSFNGRSEGKDTILSMPDSEKEDGPSSLRISLIRDLGSRFGENDASEFLKRFKQDLVVKRSGGTLFVVNTEESTSETGVKFVAHQFAAVADGLLFSMTFQTIVGREGEKEAILIRDNLKKILASLGRKSAK
ncbi:hypothetical protein GCM10007100_40110 [Roseibacillus persicicus]|uniref:Uncharacterized protein n=2 Tax=Roseibacillus persicicus TaxID=454148 RepID=A0A918TYM9_9BACT|nr:hypothetical protein GCM10007100_40110 [Roseibacillus persicicus]